MHRLLALSAERLYSPLTQQAKCRLGLIKRFQIILVLERCSASREQQALAIWLADEVHRLHGELGLKPLYDACHLVSDKA